MSKFKLSKAGAKLELLLLNAEAQSVPNSNLYAWLRQSGLPDEVAIRLSAFSDTTREVAGKLIHLGKIILIKIVDFVKAHPNLAIGIAVGAAIGAVTGMIPFLGTLLAPITALLGAGIGAAAGYRLDRREQGDLAVHQSQVLLIAEDIIQIAREFFTLFAEIFNSIFAYK